MFARIVELVDVPGIRWRLPWKLQRWTGFAWVDAGRYETENHARAAARRRGLRIEPTAGRPGRRREP